MGEGGGHMMFLVKRGTLSGGVEIFQGEGAGTMEDTMYTIESWFSIGTCQKYTLFTDNIDI